MVKKRIGFYGGTFDPIHLGHLFLAVQLYEQCDLEEVWFCPAFVNPCKRGEKRASAQDRLKMTALAVREVPGMRLLDLEVRREGPSYTIDTLKELIGLGEREFALILGEDAVPGFFLWKQAEEIVDRVPLLIGSRSGKEPPLPLQGSRKVREALRRGRVATKCFEVSSTEVRERIRKGLYIGHLVPSKVIDYIDNHQLYLT